MFFCRRPGFPVPQPEGLGGGGRGSLACLMYIRPHRTLLDAVDTFLLGTLCLHRVPQTQSCSPFHVIFTVYYPLEGDAHHVHPGVRWLMPMSTHGRA